MQLERVSVEMGGKEFGPLLVPQVNLFGGFIQCEPHPLAEIRDAIFKRCNNAHVQRGFRGQKAAGSPADQHHFPLGTERQDNPCEVEN